MRTIYVPDDSTFLVIHNDMRVQIDIPQQDPQEEIPFNSKYTVGLVHLLKERPHVLDSMVMDKFNELVDYFNHVKDWR